MRHLPLQHTPKSADERMNDYLELISLTHAIKATLAMLPTDIKENFKLKKINFCDSAHVLEKHIKNLITGHPWNHVKIIPALKNVKALWANICTLDDRNKDKDVVIVYVKKQLQQIVEFLYNLELYYNRTVTEI